MEKQKASLRVSLIPLAVLILLILGIGYLLLQGEIDLPKFNKGPTMRRLEGFPTVVNTENQLEKQRKVLKSEQELDEFLNLIDPSGLLRLKDTVNFEKEMLIGVSTALNNEEGSNIKIRKIYEDKASKKLIVQVEETQPGDTCKPELNKNISVDLISLSKTDWQIKFDKVIKVQECD